jgi:hypothetical protein
MNADIIRGAFFLAIGVISYIAWKKNNDRVYSWVFCLDVLGVALSLWQYANNTLRLASEIELLSTSLNLVLWLLIIIVAILLGVKVLKNK